MRVKFFLTCGMKIDPIDLKKTRWEKRKISILQLRHYHVQVLVQLPQEWKIFLPLQRGSRRNLSEELLNGTCLNDLWEYNSEKGQWRQLQIPKNDPVPRYNASIGLVGSDCVDYGRNFSKRRSSILFDDCHAVNVEKLENILV